jgi:hypothetical protein
MSPPRPLAIGGAAACPTDRSGESVAAADLSADKITAVAEGLAKRRDLDLQILLGDNRAQPGPGQQLLLGDQCTIRVEQDEEQIESARAQFYRDGLGKQLPPAQQYFKAPEFERFARCNRA